MRNGLLRMERKVRDLAGRRESVGVPDPVKHNIYMVEL